MNKTVIFLYGIVAYVVALIGQVWFILYLEDWAFIPETIYAPQQLSFALATVVNVALVLLFGLQHSVMARSFFKRHLTKFIPQSAERSTYVFFSGIALILVAYFWQPIDGYVWRTEGTLATVLTLISLLGWTFSVIATFIINHFELFGLQQVYFNYIEKETPTIDFQERLFYTFVRHPIQLGVLVGIWFTPFMNYGHLMFSLFFTLYIFIGLYYEEKDLIVELGETYEAYRNRVAKIIPFGKGIK